LRFVEEADYPMLVEWWQAHEASVPPIGVLPKLGVICTRNDEPVAALWLYMDNSVGVCFAEYLVTRPKLKLAESRMAAKVMFDYLKTTAAGFGYFLMRVVTTKPIARFMRQEGFVSEREHVVTMLAPIAKEDA
jgi:hypothetical protein